jgi:hypothetical protein
MRMTRRQLAGLVAAAPAAARQLAAAAKPQTAAAPDSQGQPAPSAAEALRRNAAVVRKLAVPAETEPAFSFRAQ